MKHPRPSRLISIVAMLIMGIALLLLGAQNISLYKKATTLEADLIELRGDFTQHRKEYLGFVSNLANDDIKLKKSLADFYKIEGIPWISQFSTYLNDYDRVHFSYLEPADLLSAKAPALFSANYMDSGDSLMFYGLTESKMSEEVRAEHDNCIANSATSEKFGNNTYCKEVMKDEQMQYRVEYSLVGPDGYYTFVFSVHLPASCIRATDAKVCRQKYIDMMNPIIKTMLPSVYFDRRTN